MRLFFPILYSSILFLSLMSIFLYLLGQVRMTQEVEKRLLTLEIKLETEQRFYDNFYKLGQIYLRKTFYEKAINLFRQALVNWNKNDTIGLGSLYNTLGFSYFKLKQYEYAEYYYLQAIILLPDYTLALTNLGLIYETNRMYKEAYNMYGKTLRYQSENKIASNRINSVQKKSQLIRDGRI